MSVTNEQLRELQKEIPHEYRPGPGGVQLGYITARQVMQLLDDVVGPANWTRQYEDIGGRLFCSIGIKIEGEWVFKSDCGSESNIEPGKGEVSDSFKRAAVNWGVGRFLYDLKPSSGGGSKGAPGQATEGQIKRMYAIGYKECGYSYDDIDKALERKGFKKHELRVDQVDSFIKTMQDNPKKAG